METKEQRLKDAIAYLKKSGAIRFQKEIAEKMGSSTSSVSSAINGNAVFLTNNFLLRFNASFGNMFNIEWLTDGKGEMLSPVNHTAQPADTTHMITARLVSKYAYAGYLTGYGDDDYMEELPVVTFVAEHETHGNYMAFEVRGDSMDDGTRSAYCDGDIVLCREIEREFWRDSRLFINRRDFVLVTKDGILIKRIVRHDVDTHIITIHSLNPFYKDTEINLGDVLQIFSVVFRQNNMQR